MRPMLITLALAASAIAFAPVPAAAKADSRCDTVPAQIRAAASKAAPVAAGNALRHLGDGEQLCRAGNARAAAKKFRAASKELGLDEHAELAAR